MFSAADKTIKSAPAVQQKTAGTSFFRKAGEQSFFGNQDTPAFFNAPLQSKLTVSTPDGPHEREADAVAEKVMRMPEPVAAPLTDKKEEKLDRKEEEELQTKEEATVINKLQAKQEPDIKLQAKACSCGATDDPTHIQAKLNRASSTVHTGNHTSLYPSDVMRQSGRGPPANSIPFEQTLASSKGEGSALPGDTKQFMESRFGADFSGVRIHTGSTAEQLSRSVNAQAFAHGNDIYFNSGKYSPDTTAGKTLLAHELTHTIQQGASKHRVSTKKNYRSNLAASGDSDHPLGLLLHTNKEVNPAKATMKDQQREISNIKYKTVENIPEQTTIKPKIHLNNSGAGAIGNIHLRAANIILQKTKEKDLKRKEDDHEEVEKTTAFPVDKVQAKLLDPGTETGVLKIRNKHVESKELNLSAFKTQKHKIKDPIQEHGRSRISRKDVKSSSADSEASYFVHQNNYSSQIPIRIHRMENVLSSIIQRDETTLTSDSPPTSTTASPPSGQAATPTTALSPEAARQLLYATTTLRRVTPLSEGNRTTLENAIPGAQAYSYIQERDQKRTLLTQKTEELEQFRRDLASPPEHGVPPNQDMVNAVTNEVETLRTEVERLNTLIQAVLTSLHVSDEQQLITLITVEFPRMYIARGKEIAKAQLDQNKQIVEQEAQRYGIGMCVDPAERQSLSRAAQALIEKDRVIADMEIQVQTARSGVELPVAGVPEPSQMNSSYFDMIHRMDRLREVGEERDRLRTIYQLQFPILLQPNLDLSAIATGDEQRVNDALGSRLNEILANIEQTKTNIDNETVKIWNLNNITEMTNQDLGVSANTVLQAAVNNLISREQSDEAFLRIALGALAITAGIIATVASGGLALAAGAVALGIGGYQVSQSIQTFLAETAANNVALDPQVADISRNEPDLFWLVIEIVGVVFDAVQVVRVFNQMRNAARAVRATGEIGEFAQVAREALPAASAERVIANVSRQASVSASTTRSIQAVGTAFRHADLAAVARHIEQIAGSGFRRVVERLTADGSFHPLTEEALEAVLGGDRAAHLITRERALTWGGFYDGATGHMFIRPGSLENVSSTIVHESVHYVQRSFGQSVEGFVSEFEAYTAQRHFLQNLARQAGEAAVPAEWNWLRIASNEEIAQHLTRPPYGFTIPADMDSAQAVLDVIRRMRAF